MKIKSVQLKNFRNYEELFVQFEEGLNVLVGKNAQGKTNLLESIFLCAIGKSPRTNKDKEMISFHQHLAKVTTTVENHGGKQNIEIFLFDYQKKAIKIGGLPILKMGELMGHLHAVYFSPEELKLVKDSPQERRRFLDISLSQFDKQYFYALSKYNQILSQRNELLKTKQNQIQDTIGIWNEQLAIVGAKIIQFRMDFVEKLSIKASQTQKYLTEEKENLVLSYSGLVGKTTKEIQEKLLKAYKESLEKDLQLGYTTIGPHRDDMKIMLNDIDVRYYGSQGQQRTVALALKLAELEIFKDQTGVYPVLLLDDVLSELDVQRREKLLQYVTRLQTILTCTEFEYTVPCTMFYIQNGKIERREEQK